ncbi:uncharacterized protein LOC120986628 isoform X2 [Bufo bufo]|uniref:uncharacterized protein LOC120986628 isoform X2 n=1 Tax=Bufo bufo TaxID=8384 RepID=UPI001ABEB0C4|nr:uncharacterized protein LOC120986628 isoform X2 [Bufo bufo]
MGLTLQEVLVRALKKLEDSSFQRFIQKLSVWEVREEYKNIPKDKLTGKDPEHVADLINRYYRYGYGAEVTLSLLEDIGEKKVREELQQDLREVDFSGHGLGTTMFTDRVNFIGHHRSDLISRITDVDPVLRGLWDHDLLTEEQYNDVMEKKTSREKMEALCDIISHWENTGKFTAYTLLRKYSKELIKHLEAQAMKIRILHHGGCRFIDIHQSVLIKRISDVDPVLHDLRNQGLLTQEQYNDLLEKRTSEEKMTDLCDIIRYWEDTGKDDAFIVLRKHNRALFKDMEAEDNIRRMDLLKIRLDKDHFVNRHRYDLIYNIKEVNPVLDDLQSNHLLTGEQYEDLQAMTTPVEKMRRLCDILCHQSDTMKDQFYNSLWRYNYTAISDLEKTDETSKSAKSYHMSRAGDNFIDKHKEDLIERIQNVLPVIGDVYREGLLNKYEQIYITYISDPKTMMRRLYDIIRHWDDDNKKELIQILYKHNPSLIEDLTMLEGFSKLKEPETSEKNVKPWTSCVKMTGGDISCKLCGEQTQDSAYSVSPIGSIYRLELKSSGLYRCQKTGIKFLVKGPVVIEYKLDSWSDHLKHISGNPYEILGPLFNILNCGEPNAVSAVYLPHYLCLNVFDEDLSQIKCAHFRDGNMTLESPAQIEPYYIKLENPTFSCLGPLLSLIKKKLPIHGSVFIYFRILCKGYPYEEYKIHLYVLTYSTNAEKILDKKNKKCGFQRIRKPEHTDTVYTKIRYLITGNPGVLAHPKTLKFDSERYQFTELRLKEKDVDTYLSVSEETSEDTVWDAHLTQGDIKDIAQLLSSLTIREVAGACPSPHHFVDGHRDALIQRTTNIDPVLDNLLSQRLLGQEQYNTLRHLRPRQEAMRQLYDYMTSWGHSDKEKFYQALQMHNGRLIRDLENEDPAV